MGEFPEDLAMVVAPWESLPAAVKAGIIWCCYPDAEEPLLAWYREAEKADWESPAQIKEQYGSASGAGWALAAGSDPVPRQPGQGVRNSVRQAPAYYANGARVARQSWHPRRRAPPAARW